VGLFQETALLFECPLTLSQGKFSLIKLGPPAINVRIDIGTLRRI
jgi:hypothetical protein